MGEERSHAMSSKDAFAAGSCEKEGCEKCEKNGGTGARMKRNGKALRARRRRASAAIPAGTLRGERSEQADAGGDGDRAGGLSDLRGERGQQASDAVGRDRAGCGQYDTINNVKAGVKDGCRQRGRDGPTSDTSPVTSAAIRAGTCLRGERSEQADAAGCEQASDAGGRDRAGVGQGDTIDNVKAGVKNGCGQRGRHGPQHDERDSVASTAIRAGISRRGERGEQANAAGCADRAEGEQGYTIDSEKAAAVGHYNIQKEVMDYNIQKEPSVGGGPSPTPPPVVTGVVSAYDQGGGAEKQSEEQSAGAGAAEAADTAGEDYNIQKESSAQDRIAAVFQRCLVVRQLRARAAAQEQDWRSAAGLVLPPCRDTLLAAQGCDGQGLAATVVTQPNSGLRVAVNQVSGGWQCVVIWQRSQITVGPVEYTSEAAESEALRMMYQDFQPAMKKVLKAGIHHLFQSGDQQST